jgi:hypothetical protein
MIGEMENERNLHPALRNPPESRYSPDIDGGGEEVGGGRAKGKKAVR